MSKVGEFDSDYTGKMYTQERETNKNNLDMNIGLDINLSNRHLRECRHVRNMCVSLVY